MYKSWIIFYSSFFNSLLQYLFQLSVLSLLSVLSPVEAVKIACFPISFYWLVGFPIPWLIICSHNPPFSISYHLSITNQPSAAMLYPLISIFANPDKSQPSNHSNHSNPSTHLLTVLTHQLVKSWRPQMRPFFSAGPGDGIFWWKSSLLVTYTYWYIDII